MGLHDGMPFQAVRILMLSRNDLVGIGLGLLGAALIPLGWGVDWALAKIDNPFAHEAFRRDQPFDARSPSSFTRHVREGKAKHDLRRTTLMMSPVNFLHGEFTVNGQPVIPLGSGADVTSYPCNEGFRPVFRSDQFGFTNPPGAWDDPEIVLLGDSFVEGMCQPEGARIADYLRKKYRVLNLARAGAGPLIQLAILREYGTLVSPKAVLWFATDNDLKGLNEELKSAILTKYLDEDFWIRGPSKQSFSQGLVARAAEINQALLGEANRILKATAERDSIPWIRTWRWLMAQRRSSAEAAKALDVKAMSANFQAVLASAQRATTAPIVLVYLADYRRGSKKTAFLWPRFIDTTIPYGDPEVLHQWGIGHYTGLGNELVAETLINALAAE